MDTQDNWQAQQDLRIMREAKKIEQDGDRMSKVAAEAASQKAALDSIVKQGGAPDQGRNIKEMKDGIPQFH